ncbi:type II toxin-antitoxin system VapC family toxin [Candidatus Binatia bacterium]|nr:type II toxin-antitoxin system VapC family toxin [Candidatus Binatia bacterium]
MVRFWDTSAIVPLCVTEPATAAVRELTDSDSSFVVWWASRTECVSAFACRRRDGVLSPSSERYAGEALDALSAAWSEIQPSAALRRRAERLLGAHALRAADAFQLAAALLWTQGETRGREFVSFDQRLREAAAREGFSILPE